MLNFGLSSQQSRHLVTLIDIAGEFQSKAEVWERIDRRRKAIAARVVIMPDSTEQIVEERNR